MQTTSEQNGSSPTASLPNTNSESSEEGPTALANTDQMSSCSSSRSTSASDGEGPSQSHQRPARPKYRARPSSGTIIVARDALGVEVYDEHYDEGDARAMSPRRSSDEVDKLEAGARQSMLSHAKTLQASLSDILERVESVKAEHEKLEGGNKFLQSYIGQLMQTSKITSSGSSKNKGKGRTMK